MRIANVGLTLLVSILVATGNAGFSASRYDPLANWLLNLTVLIPDQHFKQSVFTLDIRGMACSQFKVETINSTYSPSSPSLNIENPSLDLEVAGISATCQGMYHTTGLSGNVSATVASTSPEHSLHLSLVFHSKNTTRATTFSGATEFTIPTSVETQQCDSKLNVADLHFGGSISAHLINLFRSEIRGYVSKALSTELCPVLGNTLDIHLTKVIEATDRVIMGWIHNQSSSAVALSRRKEGSPAWNWAHHAPLVPTTLRLLNSLVLEPFLHRGVELKILQFLLGRTVDGDCGYFFRGWNGLLKQLTNGTVKFAVPDLAFLRNITILIPDYAVITLLPKHVHLSGIDEFDQMQLLSPNNESNTFHTNFFASRGLNIVLDMDIALSETAGGAFHGEDLLESFQVSVNISSLDFASSVSLDVNASRMQTTTMNHLLSAFKSGNQQDLGCTLDPIRSFGIEMLSANVGIQSISFLPQTANATLELGVDVMINNFLRLFLTEYDAFATLAFGSLLQGPAKHSAETAANAWLRRIVQVVPNQTESTCWGSRFVNTSMADYFNLSAQAIFLESFNHFLNESVDDVNAYVECIADVVKTQLSASRPRLEFEGATMQLQNFSMDRAGSIQAIALLSPDSDGYHVANSLRLGYCAGNDTAAQNVSCEGPRIMASTELLVPSTNISGTAALSATFGSLQESISGLFLYDLNVLKNLSLLEMLSCHYCFAKPAAEVVLEADDQLIDGVSLAINAKLNGFSSEPILLHLNTTSYDGATSALRSVLSWLQLSAVEIFNQAASHITKTAQSTCGVDQDSTSRKAGTAVLSVIVFLFPLYILSHIAYLAFAPGSGPRGTEVRDRLMESIETNEESKAGVFDAFVEKNSSLMTSDALPASVRHAFPVVLLVAIALLAVSNVSVGASMDLSVSFTSVTNVIRAPSLYTFSLASTIHQMYNAGIFVLLFIVVIFSGIWPYLKLLMMFVAWVTPESVLSLNKRDRLLFSLDALSKFSLVDTFVMIIMMVSFRLNINFGRNAIVDIFVNPHFGFYGFLLATTISLLAGHAELRFHRCCASVELAHSDNRRMSLFSYSFTCDGRRYVLTKCFKGFLVLWMAATLVLLGVGSLRKCFIFEFGGLAGKLLGDDKVRSFSLTSIGASIPESVEHRDSPGAMLLQVFFYFYACIMPFGCLLSLSILMVVPMDYSQQEKWLTAAEIANAWSAIEVFVISMIVGIFQISTFASFIVGHKCDLVNQILQDAFNDDLNGDDVCYSLTASASPDVWFLLFGVVLNSALVSTLLRLVHAMVKERAKLREEASYIRQIFATCSWSTLLLFAVNDDTIAEPLLARSPALDSEFSGVDPDL